MYLKKIHLVIENLLEMWLLNLNSFSKFKSALLYFDPSWVIIIAYCYV